MSDPDLDPAAKAGGVQVLKIEYELPTVPPKPRDPFGRVTDRKETVNDVTKTHQYVYDDFGRLFDVLENNEVVGHYEYDDNGNRADGTFWKNAAGQLVEGTYVYDDQDRLTRFVSSCARAAWMMGLGAGRLMAIATAAGGRTA